MQVPKKSNLSVYLLLGFLQGAVGWLGTTFWPDDSQLAASLILGLITGVAATGLTFQLTLSNRLDREVCLLAFALGLLFAIISVWLIYQLPGKSHISNTWGNVLTASWVFSSSVLAYILLPFVQAWPKRQNGHYNYSDLYQHSWDNFFILLVAGILAGAYWLLIILWAMLFDMLGITLFKDLFFSSPFAWLTLPVLFSLGIRIGLSHESIIGTLRQIALSLCYFLMPLTAVITILFAISLPFTGLEPIWATGYSTLILLCLLGANILFINGIFQDGSRENPYNVILSRIVEVAMVLMPVYTMIAIYSIYLRIAQYGLTPKRVYLVLLVFVAFCYSASYASAVFRHSQVWMGKIRLANIIIALLVSALIVLIHSPVLNPVTWSAKDQFKRLMSGRVSPLEFDFGALKFHFGIPGQKYLQQLRNLPLEHPLKAEISNRLTAVDEVENYYQWKKHMDNADSLADSAMLETIVGNTTIPEGFISVLGAQQCRKSTCYLLPIDLNSDGREELVFFDMSDDWMAPVLYAQDDNGQWVKQGNVGNPASKENRQLLIDKLKKEKHHAVSPQYQSLQVGEEIYYFKR